MPRAGPFETCRATVAIAALLIVSLTVEAEAQVSMDGLDTETVASRESNARFDNRTRYGAARVNERNLGKDFGPEGLRAGQFLVFPSVGAAVVFDNNVLQSDAQRKSDIRSEITPEVVLRSQFARHKLDLSLGGKIVTHAFNPELDYADGHAAATGALHFDAAHTLSASVLTSLEHEEINASTGSRFAVEPPEVWHNRASIGITRDVGRLHGTLSGAAESWRYADVKTAGGQWQSQASRDQDAFSGQLAAGYRFSPGYEAIARFRATRYENDGGGFASRSGFGTQTLAGINIEANPLLRFRLMGGFGTRDFDQPSLKSIQSWIAEGEMQWLVTQQLTLYATLARDIVDEVSANGSTAVHSSAQARLEYQIWHNVVLNAAARIDAFELNGASRTDHLYTGRIGVDYYANKNWLFTFGYEHQVRESSDSSFDMTRDRVTVGAKLRF